MQLYLIMHRVMVRLMHRVMVRLMHRVMVKYLHRLLAVKPDKDIKRTFQLYKS